MAIAEKAGPAIDYQKVFTERVTIRKDALMEPDIQTTGGELLHGYLCDIYRLGQQDHTWGEKIETLCRKWNVYYVD